MISDSRTKLFFMSLILRVGWVWTLEKYVIKFYVTNWEGRVGLDPNMYNVTNFSLFFLKSSLIDIFYNCNWNAFEVFVIFQGEGDFIGGLHFLSKARY